MDTIQKNYKRKMNVTSHSIFRRMKAYVMQRLYNGLTSWSLVVLLSSSYYLWDIQLQIRFGFLCNHILISPQLLQL
jgi:hypothetical protein